MSLLNYVRVLTCLKVYFHPVLEVENNVDYGAHAMHSPRTKIFKNHE